MKPGFFFFNPVRRTLRILVWGAALTAVACDNDVNFNPTAPTFPSFTPVGAMRNLEIVGSLRAEQGSAIEATVLYDGIELAGARAVCPDNRGCPELELRAVTRSTSGHHTISFQVLSQSQEAVDYRAEGTVRVTRDGLGMVLMLPLSGGRATLRSGESVDFEVDIVG